VAVHQDEIEAAFLYQFQCTEAPVGNGNLEAQILVLAAE